MDQYPRLVFIGVVVVVCITVVLTIVAWLPLVVEVGVVSIGGVWLTVTYPNDLLASISGTTMVVTEINFRCSRSVHGAKLGTGYMDNPSTGSFKISHRLSMISLDTAFRFSVTGIPFHVLCRLTSSDRTGQHSPSSSQSRKIRPSLACTTLFSPFVTIASSFE